MNDTPEAVKVGPPNILCVVDSRRQAAKPLAKTSLYFLACPRNHPSGGDQPSSYACRPNPGSPFNRYADDRYTQPGMDDKAVHHPYERGGRDSFGKRFYRSAPLGPGSGRQSARRNLRRATKPGRFRATSQLAMTLLVVDWENQRGVMAVSANDIGAERKLKSHSLDFTLPNLEFLPTIKPQDREFDPGHGAARMILMLTEHARSAGSIVGHFA